MKTFKEYSLEDKLDRYVIDAIKKRKLARFPVNATDDHKICLLYTSPSPRDATLSRMPSSA